MNRNKLDEIRSGPFRILKKLSNTIYEVEGAKRRKETNSIIAANNSNKNASTHVGWHTGAKVCRREV